MHLVLLVRRAAPAGDRAYLRAVDRPYARVPMAGEDVMLDDDGEHGGPVEHVSWDNDGTAVLRLAAPAVSHTWLIAEGFDVIYDGPAQS